MPGKANCSPHALSASYRAQPRRTIESPGKSCSKTRSDSGGRCNLLCPAQTMNTGQFYCGRCGCIAQARARLRLQFVAPSGRIRPCLENLSPGLGPCELPAIRRDEGRHWLPGIEKWRAYLEASDTTRATRACMCLTNSAGALTARNARAAAAAAAYSGGV